MKKIEKKLNKITQKSTRWIGSIGSVILHTFLFIFSFLLKIIGVELDTILLVLTTIVSLEAIYLAIFIQMSVNQQSTTLKDVAEDIDEIQEDIDEIQEDIDEIQEKDIKVGTYFQIGNKRVSDEIIIHALKEYFNNKQKVNN